MISLTVFAGAIWRVSAIIAVSQSYRILFRNPARLYQQFKKLFHFDDTIAPVLVNLTQMRVVAVTADATARLVAVACFFEHTRNELMTDQFHTAF